MDVYSGLVVNFVEAKGVHSITFYFFPVLKPYARCDTSDLLR